MIDLSKVGMFVRKFEFDTKTNEAIQFTITTNKMLKRSTVIQLENEERLLILNDYAIVGPDMYISRAISLANNIEESLNPKYLQEEHLFQII